MILIWILFGFVAGLIARAIMPGSQNMGLIITTLLGVVGSLVGGFLGSLIFNFDLDFSKLLDFSALSFGWKNFIFSVLGALLVLFLYGKFKSK